MYRVLLVDDDRSVRYMLKRFQQWGDYQFTIAAEAADGKEALKKMETERFDLIITDIKMPGMDGIEFLTELKVRSIDVCLIFLSTHSDFSYAKQGIRLGVFDYMTKPVEEEALVEVLLRVRRHLAEKDAQQNKLEEEQKLIEESLQLYYPKNQEKRLMELMLAGKEETLDSTAELLAELAAALKGEVLKTAIVLERVLANLGERLYGSFPWLEQLEGALPDYGLSRLGSAGDIQRSFLAELARMLDIIKKYELHQADSVVRKTCSYVMSHIEEEISLELIAGQIHVSRDYIGKLFKQKTGGNFSDYVLKIKMEHAKCLLKTGEYKNYEISEKLGYSSPDYFCRLFKTYTGLTPLEFRKTGIAN